MSCTLSQTRSARRIAEAESQDSAVALHLLGRPVVKRVVGQAQVADLDDGWVLRQTAGQLARIGLRSIHP